MPRTIPVAAALVWREGRLLLGRRPPNKRHGGLWEFPGGKVREGETLREAVARELAEELRLELVSIGEVRFTTRDGDSPFELRFVDVVTRGEPHPLEHTEVGWYAIESLDDLQLAPADRRFVREGLPGRAPGLDGSIPGH